MAEANRFEYRAIPAPSRGRRVRGARDEAARMAQAVSDTLNEMAAEGWEYLHTERLACQRRKGLWGQETTEVALMLFRRARPVAPSFAREPVLGEAAALQAAAASLTPALGPARRGEE